MIEVQIIQRVPNVVEVKGSLTLGKHLQNDISLEAEVEVCDLPLGIPCLKHLNIRTCYPIDHFVVSHSLNLICTLLVYYSVVESVGACFAGVRLLDSADYEVDLLLAHLVLQVC